MATFDYVKKQLSKYGQVALGLDQVRHDAAYHWCWITPDCRVEFRRWFRGGFSPGCVVRTYYNPPVYELDGDGNKVRQNVAGAYKAHFTVNKAIQYALETQHPNREFVGLCNHPVRAMFSVTYEGRRLVQTGRVHTAVMYRSPDQTLLRKSIYWKTEDPEHVAFITGVQEENTPEGIINDWLRDTVSEYEELWAFAQTVDWRGHKRSEAVAKAFTAAESVADDY